MKADRDKQHAAGADELIGVVQCDRQNDCKAKILRNHGSTFRGALLASLLFSSLSRAGKPIQEGAFFV